MLPVFLASLHSLVNTNDDDEFPLFLPPNPNALCCRAFPLLFSVETEPLTSSSHVEHCHCHWILRGILFLVIEMGLLSHTYMFLFSLSLSFSFRHLWDEQEKWTRDLLKSRKGINSRYISFKEGSMSDFLVQLLLCFNRSRTHSAFLVKTLLLLFVSLIGFILRERWREWVG